MNKRLIRVLSGLMSVVLALSMFVFSPELIVRAEDVTDYSIACYTPNVDFGTVVEGDYVDDKQFSIVNTGSNDIELDYIETDPDDAFRVYFPETPYMHPGGQLIFSVEPYPDLTEGNYRATYTFFSAMDPSISHPATVTFTVNVKKNSPYVNKVVITPGSANSPAGKQLQFAASVSGGNNFSPDVMWAVNGQKSASTAIDATGKLTIGADESASSVMVTATSKQTPTVYDTAIVTITVSDHLVSVSANPKEGGSVSGGGSVKAGSNVTLYQSANNNYRFVGWFEKGNQIANTTQLVLSGVNADRNIEARFERVSCVVVTKVNNEAGGTVTGGGKVNYNGSVTLKATAKPGYVFEGFVENNKVISTSPTLQLNNITTEREIIASFKQTSFNVSATINPANAGKVTGTGLIEQGKNATLTATPANGYDFLNWTLDGKIVSDKTTYTINNITKNVNITVNFVKHENKLFTVVSEAKDGGVITPSGVNYVTEGRGINFNISPKNGYRIAAVIVDGTNVGVVNTYKFSDVKADHKISVSFEKDNGAAENEPDENGSAVTPEPEEEIDEVVSLGGILAQFGISEDNARNMIKKGEDLPLLKEAFENGYLRITVNSSFADVEQETSEALYYENPTLKNFESVIQASMTEEEKMSVLQGDIISYNINIQDNSGNVSEAAAKAMKERVGFKAVRYFDFTILKTTEVETSMLDETPVDLITTIRIPDDLKRDREYSILRYHDGQVDVLADLDEDPDTITFKTNKFSQYAIAYKTMNVNILVIVMIIATVISIILAAVCFYNLLFYKAKARKQRRMEKDR